MSTLIGKTSGDLTCIATIRVEDEKGRTRYDPICICKCGETVQVPYGNFRKNLAYRCGKNCKVVPKRKSKPYKKKENANCRHPLYFLYLQMKSRCSPGGSHSENYYDRGIRVCPEWARDFKKFAECVGPRPSKDYSLDRINNNGNYEPGNVRWATRSVQMNNRRPPSEWLERESLPELEDDDIL